MGRKAAAYKIQYCVKIIEILILIKIKMKNKIYKLNEFQLRTKSGSRRRKKRRINCNVFFSFSLLMKKKEEKARGFFFFFFYLSFWSLYFSLHSYHSIAVDWLRGKISKTSYKYNLYNLKWEREREKKVHIFFFCCCFCCCCWILTSVCHLSEIQIKKKIFHLSNVIYFIFLFIYLLIKQERKEKI